MRICNNCGASNPDGTAYCSNCGTKLDEQMMFSQSSDNSAGAQQPQAAKGQNANLIPILIAAVVMVAIIVTGVVIISLNKNKTAIQQEAVQTTVAVTEAAETTTKAPETTTTTTTETTTQAPKADSGTVKVYIYPGYQGSSNAGDGYEYVASDGYLFPSDTEYLTDSYLNGLTRDQIALIRNEIYARHGYIFKKSQFREYFNNQSWYYGYEPDMPTVEKSFNYVENQNIKTLVKYEKRMGWR